MQGRAWLAEQLLPVDERLTVDGCLRQLDFLGDELAEIDRLLAQHALADADVQRLMTIPGIDVVTASTLIAAIGDIRRFPTARHLVGYLGLDPNVRQSGNGPARHGRITKEGPAAARHCSSRPPGRRQSPGPLRAFAERTAARRGRHVATVAVARKLAVLAWHLLTRGEDYAFARPVARRAARSAGSSSPPAPRARKPGPNRDPIWNTTARRRREATRRAGRSRLPPAGQRLAGQRPEGGRGRDTGARISKALEGQGRAAGPRLLTPALRLVSHPHPTAVSHKGAQTRRKFDFHP